MQVTIRALVANGSLLEETYTIAENYIAHCEGGSRYSIDKVEDGAINLVDVYGRTEATLEEPPFLYDGTDLHFLDVTGKRWTGYPNVAQHLTPYITEDSKCIKISSTNGEYLIFEVGQEYSAIVDEGESVIVGKVARSQENILQIVEDEGRTIVIEKPIKMIDDGEYIAEDVYGHKIVLEAV